MAGSSLRANMGFNCPQQRITVFRSDRHRATNASKAAKLKSDWSSARKAAAEALARCSRLEAREATCSDWPSPATLSPRRRWAAASRSQKIGNAEEHTSELQS